MLELKQVTFAYTPGKPVLTDVDLTIKKGEFVAVAGRNGSGKTTVTRLIMSLKKPSSGAIFFDDIDTKDYSTARMARNIGYVFQNPDRQMFRDTVFSEIAFGPEQLGFDAQTIQTVVEQAMRQTGLLEVADQYPQSLQRGQKQRVAIASVLALQSRTLILDEPTSGQDARERQDLLDLLVALHGQGYTIILVTHDMEIIARYAQRVVVMAKGEKVFDGLPNELFDRDIDLASWGLSLPAAVRISREMKHYGIPYCCDTAELSHHIRQRLGGTIS